MATTILGTHLITQLAHYQQKLSILRLIVEPQYEAVIAAHGAYLAANSGVSIIVEGHADERGTREYNVALSERRANTVQNLLALQGASANQTEAVALGEEKPVEMGHDESSWSLNRRVELIYPAH